MNIKQKFQEALRSGGGSPTAMAQDLHFDIVKYVVAKLNETKMSKKELAQKIGVKESQVSRILNADGNLTMLTIGKLFWAFGDKPQIIKKQSAYGNVLTFGAKNMKGVYLNSVGLREGKNSYGT